MSVPGDRPQDGKSHHEAYGAPDPGTVLRVEWPGEPHPEGRLARLVRVTKTGKPVVHLYYYGRGQDRTVEGGQLTLAIPADVELAHSIDAALAVAGDDGPRARGPELASSDEKTHLRTAEATS